MPKQAPVPVGRKSAPKASGSFAHLCNAECPHCCNGVPISVLQYVKIPIPTTAAISIAPRLDTGHFAAQG